MINPEQLSVRQATSEDRGILYDMICLLENAVLDPQGFDLAFEKNMINPHIRYFIADYNGKPIGMVSCHIQHLLHHAALVSEIQEMFVEPAYRSLMIGKALMASAVKFAKELGAIQIEVTSRDYREQAHRFYQREGFEKSHVKLVRYFKNDA